MSRERALPPVGVLLRWRSDGLTQQEMAERINRENRARDPELPAVTRSAVSVALHRADAADARDRYSAEIPWAPIAKEHQKSHLLTILRTWARVNRDDPTLPENARRRYENFRARLERDQQVIDYDPSAGFTLVVRQPDDDGLIRRPAASS